MPHYHFKIHDDDQPDAEAVDLPSLDCARREALRYVAGILDEAGISGSAKQEWVLDVTDGQGLLLFSMRFAETIYFSGPENVLHQVVQP